jgi:hypothetical protein
MGAYGLASFRRASCRLQSKTPSIYCSLFASSAEEIDHTARRWAVGVGHHSVGGKQLRVGSRAAGATWRAATRALSAHLRETPLFVRFALPCLLPSTCEQTRRPPPARCVPATRSIGAHGPVAGLDCLLCQVGHALRRHWPRTAVSKWSSSSHIYLVCVYMRQNHRNSMSAILCWRYCAFFSKIKILSWANFILFQMSL